MGFRVAGTTVLGIAGEKSRLTEIALPTTTRAGDLIVLGLLGAWPTPAENDGSGAAMCGDPRMTERFLVLGAPKADEWLSTREASVYTGVAGDDLAPLQIFLETNGTQFGQFAAAKVWILRTDAGGGVLVDETRTASRGFPPENEDLIPVAIFPNLPALPGEGPGAIGLVLSWVSLVGGLTPEVHDLERVRPLWSPVTGDTGGYLDIYLISAGAGGIGEDQGSAPKARKPVGSFFVGLGLLPASPPVVRKYPRDDGLGFSSAPRHYPTRRGPVGGRVVGGHR